VSSRGTIVYVHGASDRAPDVAGHVARIEEQLALHGMPFDVLASDWGDAVGATLDRIGLAIPGAGPAVEAVSARSAEPLASLLTEGPLSELARMAGLGASDVISLPASIDTPRDADRLLAIAQGPADGARDTSAAACRAAAATVEGSPEYARARCADVPEVHLVAATARAVAATAAVAAPASQSSTDLIAPAPDLIAGGTAAQVSFARSVEVSIAQAVLAMAAATLLAGYVGVDVGPGLKRWATDVLRPHRSRIMQESFLGPADILRYLSNGGPMRGSVAGTLREAAARGGPVVAIGNSLGGIILVETLAAPDAPRADLLVTVGSQSPLLATIGALDGLGVPDGPSPFQPWLNVYDRRDFLAFVAQPVWPGESGIRDLEVDSGEGFPDSHGATYLSRPELYAAIRDHLARAASSSS